jgi:hypothetical protein
MEIVLSPLQIHHLMSFFQDRDDDDDDDDDEG